EPLRRPDGRQGAARQGTGRRHPCQRSARTGRDPVRAGRRGPRARPVQAGRPAGRHPLRPRQRHGWCAREPGHRPAGREANLGRADRRLGDAARLEGTL
ncbi:MAG: hypothetical protein AVDCRST_MAG30-1070, partial [uncultured Solirubrobacteraceae bacterium]